MSVIKHIGRFIQQRAISAGNGGPVKLAYTSFSPVNELVKGHPILILHGLFGSGTNWKTIGREVSETGRKVITVDLRNHGDSPHVPEMNVHMMGSDVELLMEDLNIKEAVLVGHSLGGKIAMALALTKPHLVSRLLVEDVSPTVSASASSSTIPDMITAMKSVTFDNSLPFNKQRYHAKQQLKPVIMDTGVLNFMLTNIELRNGRCQWKINLDAISENLDALFGFPTFNTQYKGKTLFLGGSLSPYIKKEHYPAIYKLFPNCEISHIKGAGHWVHSEKKKEFFSALMQFLDS